MVGDVNAAINGAFTGGAEAVTVSDAHWHARSLEIEALDARAHLNSGSPSPFSMVQGIDDQPRNLEFQLEIDASQHGWELF